MMYRCHDLVVPVEIKSRELVAKVLFACFAVERGYRVHLGSRVNLFDRIVPSLAPSVIVEHDVVASHLGDFPLLKKLGHAIVAWDEEVIAQPNADWYLNRRVSSDVIEMTEAHFCWGQEQADWMVRAHPCVEPKLRVTGNPRMDILRPEFNSPFLRESATYAARFGDYILINSNFNRVNLFRHDRETFIRSVVTGASLSLEWERFYREFIAQAEQVFLAYLDVVPKLAQRYPNRQIVIRPHPAENQTPWKKAVAGLDNVHVCYEGTANGWLCGAAALIHSGCTTAVEAVVLGTPAIEFVPYPNEKFSLKLPRAVSHQAETEEDLFRLVDACLDDISNDWPMQDTTHVLHQYVARLHGRCASEAILDNIADVEPCSGDFLYQMYRRFRLRLAALRGNPTPANAYRQHKFPSTSAVEIANIVEHFQASSNRFHNVTVSETANNCYLISRW